MSMTKFEQALRNAPARGGGLHQHIFKLANLGLIAGIPENELEGILKSQLSGYRPGEIEQAIGRAKQDLKTTPQGGNFKPFRAQQKHEDRPVIDWIGLRDSFIKQGYKMTKKPDLMPAVLEELSLYRFSADSHEDTLQFISTMYLREYVLFIGDTFSKEVRTAGEWYKFFKISGKLASEKYPFFIPNPLTGIAGLTKEGKKSFRCDSCVKSYKYALAEFDTIPKQDQAALWAYLISEKEYPVCSIVDSGGKSLHALIKVDCGSSEEWEYKVKNELFQNFLIKLGADPACKNPARLSRLPGQYRKEKNAWQRLLYLNPTCRRRF